jgi:hypothetical protein
VLLTAVMLSAALTAALTAAVPATCDAPGAPREALRAELLEELRAEPRAQQPLAPDVAQPVVDSTLLALYAEGERWDDFLAAARARRAMWVQNSEAALVPADALAQAQSIPGVWRLLVVAVDSCSDSVNTIPYLARLVAEVPALELRIITPRAGRELMASRRTPDGRSATPTVVILDAAGQEAGCWIERPAVLQGIALRENAGGGTPAFAAAKQAWYDEDRGASTLREVVALLAAAADGARGCDAGAPPQGL